MTALSLDLNGNAITVSEDLYRRMATLQPDDLARGARPRVAPLEPLHDVTPRELQARESVPGVPTDGVGDLRDSSEAAHWNGVANVFLQLVPAAHLDFEAMIERRVDETGTKSVEADLLPGVVGRHLAGHRLLDRLGRDDLADLDGHDPDAPAVGDGV